MAQALPFVRRKIICPMCVREGNQYSLPPNLYSVEEKDSDQHPIRLKWSNPDFQNIKPHHYALFHCPFCHFTDFEDNFSNTQTIPNFNNFKKTFYEKNVTKDKVLKMLHSKISYDNMTFESALSLHLSAVYAYELELNENYKDYRKLSRLYHRTSWLFREQAPVTGQTGDIFFKELNVALNGMIPPYSDLIKKYKPLYDIVKRRVLDLGVQFEDPKNPYLTTIKEFEKCLAEIEKFPSRIKSISANDVELISNATPVNVNTSEDIASRVKPLWDSVPTDERESTLKAIFCYEKIYSKITPNDSVNTQLGILQFLIDLCVRIDDFEKAQEYLNSLYKYCSETRQQLFQKQRSDSSAKTEVQTNKLGEILDMLVEKRRDIIDKKVEFYEPKIKKLLDENKGLDQESLKTILSQNGIPDDVIAEVGGGHTDEDDEVEDGEVEETSSKPRKKFLGLF